MTTTVPGLAAVRARLTEAGPVDVELLARFDAAVARSAELDEIRQLLAEAYRRLLEVLPPAPTESAEWASTARAYIGLAAMATGQAGR